jgi:hypothetical protein
MSLTICVFTDADWTLPCRRRIRQPRIRDIYFGTSCRDDDYDKYIISPTEIFLRHMHTRMYRSFAAGLPRM